MADLVKFAFVAGELSPGLFGRSDVEKYDLAVAQAWNWFVDYRGGISTRPGQQFCDYVADDDKPTKFVQFKFSPSASQTYVLVFSHLKVRFLQSGAYVLETAKPITNVSSGNPAVVTAVAHGFATGDWVKVYDLVGPQELNQRTYQVLNPTADTFELYDPLTGSAIDASGLIPYISGGTVARIYTVTTPYAADDLELLRADQSRSVLYLTHQSYKVRILTRVAHTNWTLAEVQFGNAVPSPTAVVVDAGSGTAGVAFQVTAVDSEGVESLPSDYAFDTTAVDYASTTGQAKVTWTKVTGARYYKVYRSQIIPVGTECSRAMQLGFVGIAYGPQFIDRNIVPDFTLTPPTYLNPFADGAIDYIEVTAPGTGYTNASVVSITTTTGSGFVGYPIVSGGALLAIAIANRGKNYAPGDTVAVTVGTGATFSITLGEATGNDPGTSAVFQQRKIYGGSLNDPLTVWGSKPGDYENMDISTIVQEDDSYEFDLDAIEVAPIRHFLATRSGLVIITQSGIWQLTGGQGVAVTPTNALADIQSYTGCSTLPPLAIDTDILYVEGKGATIRLLAYNDYTKVFAGQDLSILSNHLVPPSKPIKAWTYASDPHKLVIGVRSDGVAVVMTLVKEQNIYGWTQWRTRGLYTDVIAVQEDTTDIVYFMTQRFVKNRWTKMIETQVRREFTDVEDAWCVDAGLAVTPTYPAATLSMAAASGSTGVIFTTDLATFSPGDVGKVIRAGGGKAIIETYNSPTQVACAIMREVTETIYETEELPGGPVPLPQPPGAWTMDAPITEVIGLSHLEGETVQILADGNVQPPRTVVNGTITLAAPATRIIVGLPYRARLQTLPPTANDNALEGRSKITKALKIRIYNTRGLLFGSKLTDLMPMKERTIEALAEPTKLQTGIRRQGIAATYDYEGQIYIVVDDPVPATILGYAQDLQVGDVARAI